jgi:hypothetical protein
MKKRSRSDIERTIAAIEADIEAQRSVREKPDHTFVGLTRKALERKLRRAKSPFFDWIAWSNAAPQGGVLTFDVGVSNPDPVWWSNLAVHAFVGARNPIVANDEFLDGHDERFPTLTKRAPVGLQLAPGGFTQVDFSLRIPPGVEPTGYLANVVLFQIDFLERGPVLDRGCVFFDVV